MSTGASGNRNGEARAWPLPYLIEAETPLYGPSMLLKPSRLQRRVTAQTASVGEVGISLGGPFWDEEYEMHAALAATLPLPLEAWLRPGEDDDGQQFPLPDLFTHNAVLIVSPRFMTVATPFLRDFEVLPIRFESTPAGEDPMVKGSGEVIEGYGWLRTWRRLDVVDQSRSTFRPIPPPESDSPYRGSPVSIHDWTRLALLPIPLGEHLFGLSGLLGGRRFFSVELYRAIHEAGLSVGFGPALLELADSTNYPPADEERFWLALRALKAGAIGQEG